MFTQNPFASAMQSLPAGFMQWFLVVMALAVVIGVIFDVIHKGSARYFFENMRRSTRKGREVGGGEKVSIAVRTLAVDVDASHRLVAKMPAGVTAVSESGLGSRQDLERLSAAGYRAFLIGERFMTDPAPAAAIRGLIGS